MRNIIVFFFMIVFIYLYSYVLGGKNSVLMLYMFVISPIVSLVLILPFRQRIELSIDAPTVEVEKGGTVKVGVSIKNKSFLPVPFIDIIFLKADNFDICGPAGIRTSVGSFKTRVITAEYTAKVRGVAKVGVQNVILRDYLGFFRFSLTKHLEGQRVSGEITVLPRVYNIKSNSKIMMSTGQASESTDSESTSAGLITWAGEPGYEFREYMPGDPLHKVHWKLTAKKDVLMVRKNEGGGIPRKSLIADPCLMAVKGRKAARGGLFSRNQVNKSKEDIGEEELVVGEKILEALLSVANEAVKTGRDAEIWLYESGQWIRHLIKDRKGISELQHRLAEYKFLSTENFNTGERLPVLNIMESSGKGRGFSGGEVIVFTGLPDKTLSESIGSLLNFRVNADIVLIKNTGEDGKQQDQTDVELPALGQGNFWTVNADQDLAEAF